MNDIVKTTELTDAEFEAIINDTLNTRTYVECITVSGREFSFCK